MSEGCINCLKSLFFCQEIKEENDEISEFIALNGKKKN